MIWLMNYFNFNFLKVVQRLVFLYAFCYGRTWEMSRRKPVVKVSISIIQSIQKCIFEKYLDKLI